MANIEGTDFSYDNSLIKRLESLHYRIEKMWDEKQLDWNQLRQMYKLSKADELFHSIRIEGNTLTYGETVTVVEQGSVLEGKPIRHQTEARNLSCALDFAQKYALAVERPLSQTTIRQIHELILKELQEDAGQYRKTENYIKGSSHRTSDPFLVPQQMMELSDYINSVCADDDTNRTLPILSAAAAHTRLVHIHPFSDGNGRTARALMNLVLMRNKYPPCIITEDDRERYIDAMEFSRESGDLTPFLELALENVEEYLRSREWLASVQARLVNFEVGQSRDEYEAWHNAMTYVKIRFKHVVDNYNAAQLQTGARWKFADYGSLDISKFVKLRDHERVKKTWFFGLELNTRSRRTRYVFFFASPIGTMKARTPVVLVVAKNTEEGYTGLYNLHKQGSNVPDMFQIGFSVETRQFFSVGAGGLRERNPITVVQQFLDQVIEIDFGS